MKLRSIIIIALFGALSSPAWAWGVMGTAGGSAAAGGDTCCTGAADPDILCEDFDYADENTWVEDYDAGDDDVNQAATHSGTFSCADKGSYCLEITDNDATDEMLVYDAGANRAVSYISFYFNVVSEELESTETAYIAILSQGAAGTTVAGALELIDEEGSLKVRYKYRSSASFATSPSSSAITLNTWHRARIYHNDTDDEIAFWLDDTEVMNDTNVVVDRYWTHIILGTPEGSTSDYYTMQLDNLKVDDDTMPEGCE